MAILQPFPYIPTGTITFPAEGLVIGEFELNVTEKKVSLGDRVPILELVFFVNSITKVVDRDGQKFATVQCYMGGPNCKKK